MLIREITNDLLSELAGKKVSDVRVGLAFTAVLLDDGSLGLASTVPQVDRDCHYLTDAGDITGKSAAAMLERTSENDPGTVGFSLALATANALLGSRGDPDPGIDKCLALEGKTVGMVGHMAPLVPQIKALAKKLYVFDRRDLPEQGVLPEAESKRLLPQCDIALITSQTIVNGTLIELLDLCRGRTVALLGPTTPMWSGFARYGVTHLFGRAIADPALVLKVVSQAGGTRRFRSAAPKIFMKLKGTPTCTRS